VLEVISSGVKQAQDYLCRRQVVRRFESLYATGCGFPLKGESPSEGAFNGWDSWYLVLVCGDVLLLPGRCVRTHAGFSNKGL
jgi:hypothetical protein